LVLVWSGLVARLDRLPPEAKRLLQTAAVMLQAIADLPQDFLSSWIHKNNAVQAATRAKWGPTARPTF
jgi:hypothetical protein